MDIYDGIYLAALCQFSMDSVIDLANMTASRLFLPIKHSNGKETCHPKLIIWPGVSHVGVRKWSDASRVRKSKFGAVGGTCANQK